jgi:hypothetical protein
MQERPPARLTTTPEQAHQLTSRVINRIKRHRGAAIRYDKLAVRYLATLQVVAINEWL